MANKITLGKIRKNVKGFDIREVLKHGKSNGFVGLYAGKRLLYTYKANNTGIADAACKAITLSENSRIENKKINDYLKRDNKTRIKHESKKEEGRKRYLKRISRS